MTDAEDRECALNELITLVQPNSLPKLTSSELDEAIDHNQRARRWRASFTLAVSAVVMPTVRNGHAYRVLEGGTTGASEPTWPTGADETIVNGSVIFVEAGPDFTSVYNVRGAAEECWGLKERKAIELSVGGPDLAKISEQCQEQRKSYASVLIG